MAADQGKTSSPVALEVIARARGCKPTELGYTTLRPPFAPVSLGAIAGRGVGKFFAPTRTTPLHDWHTKNGASIEHYGEWQRPAAFPRKGEKRDEAIRREARMARTAVGLFDASPLGKIEVRGPDAREFLDRFYINNLATLKPRHARYGMMLRESGVIYDDGTIVELDPDRILISTTSGNADGVAGWLEEWRQCEWTDMRVVITPVTDQWGTIALSGPRARQVLQRLKPDCNLSTEAFPHFALREVTLLGVRTRVCRVGFSGELTYEISAPPDSLTDLWESLMHEGREFAIGPYGIDALQLLRLEKGYIHVGSDTDGTTVPDDIGWGRVADAKQRDFVGKRSLALPDHRRKDRLQLVGLLGHGATIPVGSHLRFTDSEEITDGWVTSAGIGSMDGRPIALARLRGGRARHDATVNVYDRGGIIATTRVVEPIFYDPSHERLHA
jgi:sarcosine oxidase subunit alpha